MTILYIKYFLDILVNLRGGKLSLDIDFGKDGKKIFFLDDNFTFLHFKDLIRNEYPNKDI